MPCMQEVKDHLLWKVHVRDNPSRMVQQVHQECRTATRAVVTKVRGFN